MIGSRIKKLRIESKMTQQELAEAIGITTSSVSNYERNKDIPSDKVKISLARHFNVSLDYLIGIIDDTVPPYNVRTFVLLPFELYGNEEILLSNFIDFLNWKRTLANTQKETEL